MPRLLNHFLKGSKKEPEEDEPLKASDILVNDFVLRRLQSSALEKWKNSLSAEATDLDKSSQSFDNLKHNALQNSRRTRANISAASWHGAAIAQKTSRIPPKGGCSRRLGESKLLDMPAKTNNSSSSPDPPQTPIRRPRRAKAGDALPMTRDSSRSLDGASSHEARKREGTPCYLENVKYLTCAPKCLTRDCEHTQGQRQQRIHKTSSTATLNRESSRSQMRKAKSFDTSTPPSSGRAYQKTSMKNSTWDGKDTGDNEVSRELPANLKLKKLKAVPAPGCVQQTSSTGTLTSESSRRPMGKAKPFDPPAQPSSQLDQGVSEEATLGSGKFTMEQKARTSKGASARRQSRKTKSIDPCAPPSSGRTKPKLSMKNATWGDKEDQETLEDNIPCSRRSTTDLKVRPPKVLRRVSRTSSSKHRRQSRSVDPDKNNPKSALEKHSIKRTSAESATITCNSLSDQDDLDQLKTKPIVKRSNSEGTSLPASKESRAGSPSVKGWEPSPQFLELQQILDSLRKERTLDPDKNNPKSAIERHTTKRISSESATIRCNSLSDQDDWDQQKTKPTVKRSNSEGTSLPASQESRAGSPSVKGWAPSPQLLALHQILDRKERTLPADRRDKMMKCRRSVKKTVSAERFTNECAHQTTSPLGDEKRERVRVTCSASDLTLCVDRKKSVRRATSESNKDDERTISSRCTSLVTAAISSGSKPRTCNEKARRKSRHSRTLDTEMGSSCERKGSLSPKFQRTLDVATTTERNQTMSNAA